MAEFQRLSAWGWFVRAFAAGFGVVFGIMAAGIVACVGTFGIQAIAEVIVDGGEVNSSLAIDAPSSVNPIAPAHCDHQPWFFPRGLSTLSPPPDAWTTRWCVPPGPS